MKGCTSALKKNILIGDAYFGSFADVQGSLMDVKGSLADIEKVLSRKYGARLWIYWFLGIYMALLRKYAAIFAEM